MLRMETLTKSFASDEKLTAFWPDPSNPFRIEGWKEMRKGLEGYLSAIASMAINIQWQANRLAYARALC